MDWRIYFDDGFSFSSDDGEPHEIPPERRYGVLVCAVANKSYTGRDCWNQSDFYIYHIEDGWIPVDWTGLLDQMLHNAHKISAAIQGRTVSDDRFEAIKLRARTEPGLPTKSANRKNERAGQAYGPPKKIEA